MIRLRPALLAFAVSTLGALPARAVDFTWDPGNTANGGTIDPGNGTWDTTAGNIVWNNAGVNVPWSGNNTAVFAGANGTYAVNLAADITSSAVLLHFLNSGYTLSAAAPQLLTNTFSTSTSVANNATGAIRAEASLWAEAGVTATLGNNVTFRPNGTSFGVTVAGGPGSVLNINSGAAINKSAGGFDLLFAGDLTTNVSGTVSRTVAGDNAGIGIGQWSGQSAVVNVNNGGVISTASTGSTNTNGSIFVGNFAGTTGTLNINAGATVTSTNSVNVNAGMKIGIQSGATGTVNLNGGTLTTMRVIGVAGTSNFNFNGGTLKAVAANDVNFVSGITAANVMVGGAKIDTNGFNVTIVDPLLDGDSLGGGLTKSGNGILTLSSFFNSYTGATTVNGGTVNVAGSVAGNVVLNSGAALAGVGSASGSLTANAGSTFIANTTAGVMTITGNVNFAGATGLSFDNVPTTGNTYTLFNYGGTVSNLANLIPTVRATIANVGGSVQATIGTTGTRTWNTTTGVWEAAGAALNWAEGDKKFFNGDTVIFNNPAATSTVTLVGNLLPTSATVNTTTNNYTFSGSGSITGGTTTLTKTGAGTLTINTSNTYGGGTTVTGGRVVIASDAALGAGTGALDMTSAALQVTGNGTSTRNLTLAGNITIEVDPTFTYSTSGAVADGLSPAVLTKTGAGTLALNGTSTISGGASLQAGTLSINGTLGPVASTSTIAMTAGTTLALTGGTNTNTVTGSGAIRTTAGTVLYEGDWSGFSGTFTQNSGGNSQLNTPLVGSPNVAYEHLSGELIFSGTPGGPADYTIKLGSLASNAGLNIRGANTGASGAGTVTLEVGHLGTSTTIAGGFNNGDTNNANHKNLALHKVGAGTLTMGGGGNYSGGTTVSAGTLLVNATHTVQLPAAGPIASTTGYVVESGGTLGGSGTINTSAVNTSVVVNGGGNLAPGAATPGTLTMDLGAGILDLSAVGAGGLKFDLGALATSDKVTLTNAFSTLDIGTLSFADFAFTNAGVANGVYTLFDAAAPIVGSLVSPSGSLFGGTGTLSLDAINNDILLTVAGAGVAGDFNGDGRVNGTDFLVWQRGGSPSPNSAGDLATWRANYGAGGPAVPAASAVPEPAACMLILVGAVGLLATRRLRTASAD